MKPPVVIDENGNILIYRSVEEAATALEPIDVKNDEYIAYDSEGRLLTLETDNVNVMIYAKEHIPLHADELEMKLREFLFRIGEPRAKDVNCRLSCLVDICRKFME